MKHKGDFKRICVCSDCDGAGEIEISIGGPNDPDVRLIVCEECDGTGEVYVDHTDADEEQEDA